MSKKAKVSVILAVILIISAVIAVLVIRAINDKKNKEDDSGVFLNDNCTHDENYKEPELKIGKYYYNGDTTAKYIEVTDDGYMHYKGATPEEFAAALLSASKTEQEAMVEKYRSWVKKNDESDFYEVPEQGSDIEFINNNIDFFSTPKEYKVYTDHKLSDTVKVYEEWEVTSDGVIQGSCYEYVDENTLERNSFTRFIYIDNPQ